jgi:sugar phosphate isomerase/epimerase
MSALRTAGYDYAMSIEHEDGLMSLDEGLEKAVSFLRGIILADRSATDMWWA